LGLLGRLPCSTSMRVQDRYSAGVAFPANRDSSVLRRETGEELQSGFWTIWRL
jgi:hypothetical protein